MDSLQDTTYNNIQEKISKGSSGRIRQTYIVILPFFTTMKVCQILPEVPLEFFSWKLEYVVS